MTLAELMAFAGRHPLLSLALAGITVAILYNEIAGRLSGVRRLGAAQLTALINRENALVLDIRGQAEFEKGHIIGSRHLLPSQVDPEGKLLAKAKESPVVVVCLAGMTATGVAQKLAKAGFKRVSVLEGGIGAWQQAGLPLAKGKA